MAYSSSILTSSADFTAVATLTDSLHDETTTGWAAVSETFTYASATTITIATGGASRFQVGDKLKLTNSTLKYLNIVTVADTLLTVYAGTDYTLANAAITGVYISRAEAPLGFPAYFSYTPTLSASGSMTYTSTSISFARYRMVAKYVHFRVSFTGTVGGTPSTALRFTLPITAPNENVGIGANIFDNGATRAGFLALGATTRFDAYRYDGANYTAGAASVISHGFYEAA